MPAVAQDTRGSWVFARAGADDAPDVGRRLSPPRFRNMGRVCSRAQRLWANTAANPSELPQNVADVHLVAEVIVID